jgi:hypothetical protein
MKKILLALIACFTYSSQGQADLLSELLNDKALDAINCNDLNYDHDTQRYNLSINIAVQKNEIKEVTLKKNYGEEILIINKVEASADLKTLSFLDYTLELTGKQFFDSHQFWATLKKSDAVVADVVCGFGYSTTGE